MRTCLQDYCTNNPDEISRIAACQKKIVDVKNVMVENIEKVGGSLRQVVGTPTQKRWGEREGGGKERGGRDTWVPACSRQCQGHRACSLVSGRGAGAGRARTPSTHTSQQRNTTELVLCRAVLSQVLARGEKIELLVDKCDDLQQQAHAFEKKGKQLRSRMWWQNTKMKIVVVFAVLLLAVVIFLLACFAGGQNCTKKGS